MIWMSGIQAQNDMKVCLNLEAFHSLVEDIVLACKHVHNSADNNTQFSSHPW